MIKIKENFYLDIKYRRKIINMVHVSNTYKVYKEMFRIFKFSYLSILVYTFESVTFYSYIIYGTRQFL